VLELPGGGRLNPVSLLERPPSSGISPGGLGGVAAIP